MRVHLRHELGDGLRLIALRLEVGLNLQGHAALALFRAGRAVRHEGWRASARDQRMLLHQGLRSLAKSWRAAVGA